MKTGFWAATSLFFSLLVGWCGAETEINCNYVHELCDDALPRHFLFQKMTPELIARVARAFTETVLADHPFLPKTTEQMIWAQVAGNNNWDRAFVWSLGSCAPFERQAVLLHRAFIQANLQWDPKYATRTLLEAIARSLDPHSMYVPRDEMVTQQKAENTVVVDHGLVDGFSVGILAFSAFDPGTQAGVESALEGEIQEGGPDVLILDLRGNSGGLVKEAAGIASIFLREGPIAGIIDQKLQVERFNVTAARLRYSGPLLVLVNSQTASAAEILAGALRDYKRAIVIGATSTFGKGTVQEDPEVGPEAHILFPDGVFRLTTGMTFGPTGLSVQNYGVGVDIRIPGPALGAPMERKLIYSFPSRMLKRALATNEEIRTNSDNRVVEHLSQLRVLSKARVKKARQGEWTSQMQIQEAVSIGADFARLLHESGK